MPQTLWQAQDVAKFTFIIVITVKAPTQTEQWPSWYTTDLSTVALTIDDLRSHHQ